MQQHEGLGIGLALTFLPDGKTLAIVNAFDPSYTWLVDAKTGKVREKLSCPEWSIKGDVYARLSPGAHLLALATDDTPLRVWQVGSDVRRLRAFRLDSADRVRAMEQPFAFSSDGRYLAVGNPGGVISLLRLSEPGKLPEMRATMPTARELAGRPNGADSLKHEDVPEVVRVYVGGGDPKKVPELVGAFGDPGFACADKDAKPLYSPDGNILALLGQSGVFLFKEKTGLLLRKIDLAGKPEAVRHCVFSPDNRLIAAWSSGDKVSLWETASGKKLLTLEGSDNAQAAAFLSDSTGLVVCCEGELKARLYGVWKGNLFNAWENKEAIRVRGAANWPAHPDGTVMAVLRDDNRIELRKNDGAATPWKMLDGAAVCISTSGWQLAAATGTGIGIYDTKGDKVRQLPETAVGPMAFIRDDKLVDWDDKVLVVFAQGRKPRDPDAIHRWRLDGKQEVVRLDRSKEGPCLAAFSPDGKTLAVRATGQPGAVLRLFDTTTGQERHPETAQQAAVTAMAWSPDGQRLVAADTTGRLALWDLAKQESRVFDRSANQIHQVVFSADGRWLVARETQRQFGESVVMMWNTQDWMGAGMLPLRSGQKVQRVAISPDASLIATINADKTVSLWRREERTEKFILPQVDDVSALAFSPDGTELLTGTRAGQVSFWNVDDGRVAHKLPAGQDWIQRIESLGDGSQIGLLYAVFNKTEVSQKYVVWDRKADKISFAKTGIQFEARNVPLLAVSPTSRLMAYADPMRKLALWQPSAEEARRRYFDNYPAPEVAAFSPDGRYLAVGDQAGVVSLLRLSERGQLPQLPPYVVDAQELAWRPNAADALRHESLPENERAYFGGGDPGKAPPELVSVLGDVRFRYPGDYGPLAFSPDGKLLAMASAGKIIRIFGMANGLLLREFPSPESFSYRLVFSPDGKFLAGVGPGGKFALIDAKTGQLVWELKDTKLKHVLDFAFSADGQQIVLMSGPPNKVETHEVATGKKLQSFEPIFKDLTKVAIHPKHEFVAAVGFESQGWVWDEKGQRDGLSCSRAVQVAFSGDGKWLAVARAPQDQYGDVTLFEIAEGGWHTRSLDAAAEDLLAFSRDSKTLIAVGHKDDKMVISRWDVAKCAKLGTRTYPRPRDVPIQYAIDPDGKLLAVSVRGDPVVHIYETESGERRGPDPGHLRPTRALAFSPDGKLLASSDQSSVKLWDLATAKTLRTWEVPDVYGLAFSPDSQTLATFDGQALATVGQRIRLYRVKEGDCTYESKAYGHAIFGMAFSPDGSLLASAGEDGLVRIHNLVARKEERILDHSQPLRAVRFSADGRHIFSAGKGRLRIWEASSGLERHSWGLAIIPRQLELLPGGHMLAVLSQERAGEGEVWHVDWMTGEVKEKWVGFRFPPTKAWNAPALGPLGRLTAVTLRSPGTLLIGESGTDPFRQRTIELSADARDYVGPVDFSPDGRYVAVGDPAGLILLLRLSERGQVPEMPVVVQTKKD
jgi:WD40 repeat protein